MKGKRERGREGKRERELEGGRGHNNTHRPKKTVIVKEQDEKGAESRRKFDSRGGETEVLK